MQVLCCRKRAGILTVKQNTRPPETEGRVEQERLVSRQALNVLDNQWYFVLCNMMKNGEKSKC